jgi:hypothetical protein
VHGCLDIQIGEGVILFGSKAGFEGFVSYVGSCCSGSGASGARKVSFDVEEIRENRTPTIYSILYFETLTALSLVWSVKFG